MPREWSNFPWSSRIFQFSHHGPANRVNEFHLVGVKDADFLEKTPRHEAILFQTDRVKEFLQFFTKDTVGGQVRPGDSRDAFWLQGEGR